MSQWFFLDDQPASGSLNMAYDEHLFSMLEKWQRPILRLYSFDPPAITLGYHQEFEKVLDAEALHRDQIEVARRITGGRALLHKNEVTYCVLSRSADFGFGNDMTSSFMRISAALKRAINSIGIEAEISPRRSMRNRINSGERLVSPCLASVTRYELTVGGKKIAGSAQRRRNGAFLQHGSILLGRGSEEIARYLKGDWSWLNSTITSIADKLGKDVTRELFKEKLKEGFITEFGVELEPLKLSIEDRDIIEEKASDKRDEFSRIYKE